MQHILRESTCILITYCDLMVCLPLFISALCPVGHWQSNSSCQACPLNTYQDQEGQPECQPCPPDTITVFTGARNVSECRGMEQTVYLLDRSLVAYVHELSAIEAFNYNFGGVNKTTKNMPYVAYIATNGLLTTAETIDRI